MKNHDITRRMELLQQQYELEREIEQLSRAKAELEDMRDGPTGEVAADADKEASHPAAGDVHAGVLVHGGREMGVSGVHAGGNPGGTGEATTPSEQGGGGGDPPKADENAKRRQEQQVCPAEVRYNSSEPVKHTMSPTRDEAVKALAVIAESVEELLNGEECWTVEQLVGRLRFIQRYAHEILGD